jgi:predicted ester cyclase
LTAITDLVLRFYRDAWNRWDDLAVDVLLADDFVFRGSLGDEARGRDGFRAYRDKLRIAFPDFHNEVRELVVNGERAAVRLLCTGRHDSELFGIRPTGRRVAYEALAAAHCGACKSGTRRSSIWFSRREVASGRDLISALAVELGHYRRCIAAAGRRTGGHGVLDCGQVVGVQRDI